METSKIIESLFEEFDLATGKINNQVIIPSVKSHGAMDQLLKQASLHEKSGQKLTDTEVIEKVPQDLEIGQIQNIQGIPKVVIEDKYLEPYKNDLLLRQDEFKKWLNIF